MLRTTLGQAVAVFLEHLSVVEAMLTMAERLSSGLSEAGEDLSPPGVKRIVRLVHVGSSRISAELPEAGETVRRFAAAGRCRAGLCNPQARCRRV